MSRTSAATPGTVRTPLIALSAATALLVVAALAGAMLIVARFSGVARAALLMALLLLIAVCWWAMVSYLLRRYVSGPLAHAEEVTRALVRIDKLAATGRLAAGIAHEVGNPLAAIANYAQVARQRAAGGGNVEEPLEAIEREVERIDRIVRGLLDYARPRRRTPRAVRVDDVIVDALRLLTDQGVLRRVDVQHIAESGGAAVFAERHDLAQVFVNLLLNAVDAMSGIGRITLRTHTLAPQSLQASEARRASDEPAERFPHQPNVRGRVWMARTAPTDTVLQVIVADSGPGVPGRDVDRVFDPFYSTKGEGRGTGLGLAIVAQTIEGLGGTVWVQPSREGGAAFVILLPMHGNMEARLSAN